MKKYRIRFIIICVLLLGLLSTFLIDVIRISNYDVIPMRPVKSIDSQQDQVYYDLVNHKDINDWNRLNGTLEYICGEYDCSDFRLVNLIRILYEYGGQIPDETREKIDETLLNFRYWWDEPGENSMCYWSENHQILFASAEYLVGQLYRDTTFPSSGLTGQEHVAKARKRILDWLEMRWTYGFTEFYSSVYYKEDIGAMINIIDFAEDEELVKKTQIVMDLLLYDVAVQSFDGMFSSVSGRAYERNRKGGPHVNLGGLTTYYWGDGTELKPGMVYGMMVSKIYTPPPVLAEIASDTSPVIIKQSNGLDISELRREGFGGLDDRSMMMQWGMECFTNPEVVRNSLSHMRRCSMFSNEFIKDFWILDFTPIRLLHLEPLLIRLINPQSNGVAIQRGNTYTYKTRDYSMYTAQGYHPGTYGDQQHVFGMNIGNHFSVFHTHPALEAGVKHQSPNYWVGYGHLPHVVQKENVSLAIYHIPAQKGLMELDLLDYTHAYFPREEFEEVIVKDNYALGKKVNTYCAFIGTNSFHFRDGTSDDLIQPGKKTYWIAEAGSKQDDESFEAFCQRIIQNEVTIDSGNERLIYHSKGKVYQLDYQGDFSIDGKVVQTDYMRFDSPYCRAEQKAKTLMFTCDGISWRLDFDNMIREPAAHHN